jgi:GNAT superfamily N-acetyltransferase
MQPAEHREVVASVARAFWHDPLFDEFSRDLLHQQRLLPIFFGAAVADVTRAGNHAWVADVGGRPRGYAGWLPPGRSPRTRGDELRFQLGGLPAVVRSRRRMMGLRLLNELARRHPTDPHWYLEVLAVDPSLQGRGAGGDLLRPVLGQCDEQGLAAYLETQKEANLPFYARFGFAVADEIRLAGAPPVWCMRREAR